MDVFTAIQERRSIRKYKSTPVEETKMDKIIEALRLSPSAVNAQNWKFIIVKDQEKIKQLTEAAGGQEFLGQAPVVIVGCGLETDKVMMCGQYRYNIDVSIAFAYMILEAQELGLGTCWLGRFEEDKVKKILHIPDDVRVVAVTPLGYADESPEQRTRKEQNEIVSYEEY